MRHLVALLLVAATVPSGVSAANVGKPRTGSQLLSWCKANINDPTFMGSCWGYIEGVLDASSPNGGRRGLTRICAPPATSAIELQDIVRTFLERHPERQKLEAAVLVRQAVAEAFPCR